MQDRRTAIDPKRKVANLKSRRSSSNKVSNAKEQQLAGGAPHSTALLGVLEWDIIGVLAIPMATKPASAR